MAALRAARALDLPDWYIAAGFVRNAVWDHLHGYTSSTPLNDIDLIYFDADKQSIAAEQQSQRHLCRAAPHYHWQVRNQARMHGSHRHAPYSSCADAMSYWVEKETAIGMRLNPDDSLTVHACYGLASLFNGVITFNPTSTPAAFEQRVTQKQWLTTWPRLRLIH